MDAPPWPWVAVVTVGFMLLLLFLAGTRRVVRELRCPRSGRDVVVAVHEAAWDGRPIDVESCTAFSPPTAVRCDRACLLRCHAEDAEASASHAGAR
jgi:hypothetical protein